jgi:hypothetical protein
MWNEQGLMWHDDFKSAILFAAQRVELNILYFVDASVMLGRSHGAQSFITWYNCDKLGGLFLVPGIAQQSLQLEDCSSLTIVGLLH